MRKIHLYGEIAKKYGDMFELEVETAAEAVYALCTNFPDMQAMIRADTWCLFRGDPKTGLSMDEEAIGGMSLGKSDLHIMPEVFGSKKGNGILKAVVGVALIAVSFGSAAFLGAAIAPSLMGAMTWGNAIGQLGLALAVSGISSMLTPKQSSQPNENEQSFVFSGPSSQTQQGSAIPLVYGEVITGGVIISAGLDAVNLRRGRAQAPRFDGTVSPVFAAIFNSIQGE